MQKKKETYEAPFCQVHFVESESILDVSGTVSGWEYGGALSKKNFFEEEDTESTNKSAHETN